VGAKSDGSGAESTLRHHDLAAACQEASVDGRLNFGGLKLGDVGNGAVFSNIKNAFHKRSPCLFFLYIYDTSFCEDCQALKDDRN
jgi:hypothetical protein